MSARVQVLLVNLCQIKLDKLSSRLIVGSTKTEISSAVDTRKTTEAGAEEKLGASQVPLKDTLMVLLNMLESPQRLADNL